MKMFYLRNFIGLIFISLFLLPISCRFKNEGIQKNDIEKVTSAKIGKIFKFPDTLKIVKKGIIVNQPKDQVIKNPKATILIFTWGDCHVCMKKFEVWNSVTSEGRFNGVQFIFVVITTQIDYFLKIFYPNIKCNGLIILDNNDQFYSLNELSNYSLAFNTFLIDEYYKIKLVGDPIDLPDDMKQFEDNVKKCNN